MLSLTRKTDYALAALVALAQKDNAMASARELSEGLHVPLRALTNILNKLKHEGMVSSVRGADGGYKLAKPLEELTLAMLIESVEGPVQLTRCCVTEDSEDDPKCHRISWCDLSEALQKVHASLRNFLDQVTLADLASNKIEATVPFPLAALDQVGGGCEKKYADVADSREPLALDKRDTEET